MRYAMKQKLFCLADDYRILDEDGRDVYLVDGKAFVVLQKRLAFLDMAGNELAEIRQRLLSWGPSYDILRSGKVVATVSKHVFTLMYCKFTVDVPGPDDLGSLPMQSLGLRQLHDRPQAVLDLPHDRVGQHADCARRALGPA